MIVYLSPRLIASNEDKEFVVDDKPLEKRRQLTPETRIWFDEEETRLTIRSEFLSIFLIFCQLQQKMSSQMPSGAATEQLSKEAAQEFERKFLPKVIAKTGIRGFTLATMMIGTFFLFNFLSREDIKYLDTVSVSWLYRRVMKLYSITETSRLNNSRKSILNTSQASCQLREESVPL